MAKLNECDSCGKTGPDTTAAGMMYTPSVEGGDKWTTLNVMIVRKTDPPEYMGVDPKGIYYTQLPSRLELCPDCAERVLQATGCIDKIMREVPPPRPPIGMAMKA